LVRLTKVEAVMWVQLERCRSFGVWGRYLMCPSPVRHINANSIRLMVSTQLMGGCVSHLQSQRELRTLQIL